MHTEASGGIEIAVPYLHRRQVVSSARYSWNCRDRGKNPFVILQWTHSGEGIFESEQGSVRVPADHAFIAVVPERSSYHYPPDGEEPWIFSWLNFYGAQGCDLFRKLQFEFGPVIPLAPRGAAAASLRRLLARGEGADRFQISLQSYAFALEWWREASRPTGGPENRLNRVLRFALDHFREPLGVKELAGEAGLSREHFSRIFTEQMGETPSAYLQRLRMAEATIFVRETDMPLREIAMRSGFYSERQLMRTFQRVHRTNPSHYRRRKGKSWRQRA
jgi:AraC-like DNA-binding protein